MVRKRLELIQFSRALVPFFGYAVSFIRDNDGIL